MTKPFELKTAEQRKLWSKYVNDIKNHWSWKVRNTYFKNRNMDLWEEELKKIERDMREKMKILQIQQNKEETETLQMNKEEKTTINIEKTKKKIEVLKKQKETREKNKEVLPIRRSKRIKNKQTCNDVEIISIKTLEQRLKEKMEEAMKNGNFIDLTI